MEECSWQVQKPGGELSLVREESQDDCEARGSLGGWWPWRLWSGICVLWGCSEELERI